MPSPFATYFSSLGELELYDQHWSERILEEPRRNLVTNRLTEDHASGFQSGVRRQATCRPSPGASMAWSAKAL